jgi:hypothetical protein
MRRLGGPKASMNVVDEKNLLPMSAALKWQGNKLYN